MSSKRAVFGSGEVPDRDVEAEPVRGEGVTHCGAIVVDADADEVEPTRAVVINTPPIALGEWTAYHDGSGEVTVADDNPAYDASDEVVVVAFEDDLDTERPNYNGEGPLTLASLDCRYYAFPPRRLLRLGHVAEAVEDHDAEDGTTDDGQHPELTALAERVDGKVLVEDGEAVVVVERLGATHHISADGEVDGGPMAKQLTEAAAEVLGGVDQ